MCIKDSCISTTHENRCFLFYKVEGPCSSYTVTASCELESAASSLAILLSSVADAQADSLRLAFNLDGLTL
jgi:hypothetical protein